MVRISYEQKPFRRSLIQAWGATIVASPSDDTQPGRAILEQYPDSPGSLGIAISEAVEDAASRDDTAYSLGSVLNHVLLHQTVIGQEALAQMELAGAFPDVVIGCVGGGSNFAGLAFPFLREKIAGREIDVLACEPAACPTLTRGLFAYDFGDTSKLTPLVPMHTLGHDFVPEPIHAGGLRYHGVAPLISQLVLDGLIRAEAYVQSDVFASAVQFAGTEGIIPAPESAHAIHGALRAGAARPTRPARSARSSSTSPATAISTWPPTTTTSPASSSTSPSTRTRCSARCARSRGFRRPRSRRGRVELALAPAGVVRVPARRRGRGRSRRRPRAPGPRARPSSSSYLEGAASVIASFRRRRTPKPGPRGRVWVHAAPLAVAMVYVRAKGCPRMGGSGRERIAAAAGAAFAVLLFSAPSCSRFC